MINSLDNNNTTVHSIVHIVSKEVYLQMKHDQKIINGNDTDIEVKEYERLKKEWAEQYTEWISLQPVRPDTTSLFNRNKIYNEFRSSYDKWDATRPVAPIPPYLSRVSTRAMNIVYGIAKGKSYKQIESKVRKYNEPRKKEILTICDHYDINLKKLNIEWRDY